MSLLKRMALAPLLALSLASRAQGGAGEGGMLPADVRQLSDSLKQRYAPDPRVALFDVEYFCAGRVLMVRGVTTSSQAKAALLHGLQGRYAVTDCLKLLPDTAALEGQVHGVVSLSVCNLHAAPDFASEMVSQALLGTPVRVLQCDGWYRVQTPDRYIAWVHRAAIRLMGEAELEAWNQAPKLVVTSSCGTVYARPDAGAQPVSDVVAGNRLKLEGEKGRFYLVSYPDGRKGYLHKSQCLPERQWRASLQQSPAAILQTANGLTGVPYLWGGMSSKGIDCSGFVRAVFYMHDIILPRDASQQARVGDRIDIAADFSNLQPGDLLFFGRKATPEQEERVVHVGIYAGDGCFIHSQGDVHASSLNPADPLYDAFNRERLLFAARVLPYINKVEEVSTTLTNPFYR